MAGFGEDLRAERERRGLSLETLCVQTKVQARHLEALEHGDYGALPGGVFRKGIVRAYLAATGLEEQAWMPRFEQSQEEYARATGTTPAPEAWVAFAENVRRNRVGAGRRNGVRWAGVAALLLVLLAAAWAVWHYLLRYKLRAW